MAVSLYMDHHVPKAITTALRLRGVDVLTAYEDGADQLDDERVLQRAHDLIVLCLHRMTTCWRKPRNFTALAGYSLV